MLFCTVLLFSCQSNEQAEGDGEGAQTSVRQGNGAGNGQQGEQLPVTELDGNYEMAQAEYNGKNVDLRAERGVLMSFERGKMSGRSVCNGFSADFALAERSKITLTKFQKGNRICSGKMGKDASLIALVEKATTYEILAKTAVRLNSENGYLVLRKVLK